MLGGPGAAVDVFCAAEVADALAPGESLRQWNGLHLTAAVLPETAKLRLFFDSQAEPLMLSESEVAHFRSFLQVTVVEQVLARLQAGEPMQIDAPFARLRDFGGFLTVCAGGHGVPEGATPLKMALAPDAGGSTPAGEAWARRPSSADAARRTRRFSSSSAISTLRNASGRARWASNRGVSAPESLSNR